MRKLSSVSIRCLFITLAFAISVSAQQPFNKGEFEARRAKLFEKINDGRSDTRLGSQYMMLILTGLVRAVNMTAGVPAALDEIYALIRQRALSTSR